MSEKSWPWSTVAGLGDGASELNEALSREFLATFFLIQDPTAEGVCKGLSIGELEVSGIATPLSVDPGAAICYGLYINDAIKTLAVSTPAVGTTGGRVVLQTNWAGTGGAGLEARTRLAVIMSADGVPGIPALTQAFGTTWEISLATFTITTGAGVITVTDDRTFRRSTAMVDTDEITEDAVDDLRAGDRVPQFYRRQGGSASDWSAYGTNNYTPTAVRMQAGVIRETDGGTSGSVAVTFPVAFSDEPIVLVTLRNSSGVSAPRVVPTASGVTIYWISTVPESINTIIFNWLAIGPE